ncbi:MAG: MazF family transcriptional regulator [candidate division KSB1 bacterium]|nr:MazF family transcriptional regulator [candidate division KSB1 bacterium]MDZ7304919.1 MazF family transcriptional regulator [candidate division KSB1 bacterium]MDZ7313945.1 MazF family transcriptional regulator [candidate division KSB1 bacterium]
MGALTAGSVVSVPFPFTDLSQSKLRLAVVLAGIGRNDWILCQVTSNPYSDPKAVTITDDSFAKGSLQKKSYARPGKLFTANEQLIVFEVGLLKNKRWRKSLMQ